jgi:hypothetical protein
MINLTDVSQYQLLEMFIAKHLPNINPNDAFVLGRVYNKLSNVLWLYYKDPSYVNEMDMAQVPEYIKLLNNCNIDPEIFSRSKEELCEILEVEYYTMEKS